MLYHWATRATWYFTFTPGWTWTTDHELNRLSNPYSTTFFFITNNGVEPFSSDCFSEPSSGKSRSYSYSQSVCNPYTTLQWKFRTFPESFIAMSSFPFVGSGRNWTCVCGLTVRCITTLLLTHKIVYHLNSQSLAKNSCYWGSPGRRVCLVYNL